MPKPQILIFNGSFVKIYLITFGLLMVVNDSQNCNDSSNSAFDGVLSQSMFNRHRKSLLLSIRDLIILIYQMYQLYVITHIS